MNRETQIAAAALQVQETCRAAADRIATDLDLDNAATFAAIMKAAAALSLNRADFDGRAAKWRCRFRFYDNRQPDEPYADSDAELPPDREGTEVLAGLPAVATRVADYARAIHGPQQFAGLDSGTLTHRLKSLRPTLSRRGGNATWRIPYDTLETFNEQTLRRGWLCRVDITREP